MNSNSLRIRGTSSEIAKQDWPKAAGIGVRPKRRLIPGTARDGVTGELEVAAEDVVRVELENGFVLWSRADDLVRDYGREALGRDGGVAFELGALAPARGTRGERGLLGLGIKVLDFFGIDIEEKAARGLGTWVEEKQLEGNAPGLYRCSLDDELHLTALGEGEAIAAGQDPILVFLHGTASSCRSSFGKLWAPDNVEGRKVRARLKARYGERVFAFEHRTFTESPIANALELANRLPEGARLHLVSHSRGGLVGEVLCLGGCPNVQAVLSPDQIEALFAADRTIALQLGLSPLDEQEAKERDEAYRKDREALPKLLARASKLEVARFVRVACPARGTTLASGRLDRWLSVLNFLGGSVAGEGLFADGLDFLLGVVKERTDPRTLPGIEAMMPGSALTRLLHAPALKTKADLTVISGDIEGDSLWQKIKILATDWFYSADHDLVVNTGSMSGGLRRVEKGARFRKDAGPAVNHFSYFANARSVRWLADGLTRADGDDAGFLPIAAAQKEAPKWRGAADRSRGAAAPRPLAVVIPGIMGSHLKAGGDHVWLNYGSLCLGGLKKLAMDGGGVEPIEPIDDFYGPLLEFLSRTHRVEVFAYDWRQSVRTAAADLAKKLEEWLPRAEKEQQPVHLVAHSMGGLVVRAMIADGGRGAAAWARIISNPKSRFLMLGTPNFGSYEAVRWLTGRNPTQAKLSLLDITQGTDDIVKLVRDFPGLLELLPFGGKDGDFSDPERWREIKLFSGGSWETAREKALRDARGTWQLLRDAALDPRRACYVAGCQPATVADHRFADAGLLGLGGRKRLEFLATRDGDGTVTWESGRLRDVKVWYAADTAHDALCAQPRHFPAYLDLLTNGRTDRLPDSPPGRSRAATGEPERFILPSVPPADGVPEEADLRGFGFGSGLPPQAPEARPGAPTIEVSIRHGDLSYARHPVLVGHYAGDAIVNAERALDRRLGDALTRRLDLALYPGPCGTHAVFFHEKSEGKPGGAIVVGLGQVGELTPGLLEAGVRAALLDYALQVAQWPNDRFGPREAPRRASVSCLLVGSGAGGMTVRESVESILRGAVAANQRLVDALMDERVTVDKLEFLELYEDMAIQACTALRMILKDGELAGSVSWPGETVEAGQAGLRRVRFEEAAGWWHRLEIIEEKGRADVLRFVFSTDRARAEETLATGQLALADSFIRDASRSASANPDAARTLFEMLLPLRLREGTPWQTSLVLLVDERSARYPWELLEDRWSANGRPPTVNAGMVRQLKTTVFRPRPAHAAKAKALVVGNPDLAGWDKFSELQGARREAQRVAGLLSRKGFETRECIDDNSASIMGQLHRDAWRILHLAGHGVHDFPFPASDDRDDPDQEKCRQCGQKLPPPRRPVSGMVIGKGAFLTAGDVEQMRWVPELVFVNCCHLGRTGSDPELDRGALAANLGMQFIRMGVRAVVAAGWAVDDEAALAFAETFYSHLLAGDAFGEAVRAAREEIWLRFPAVNTWGAYQCYGDPAYRLKPDRQTHGAQPELFHAPSELVAALDNLASDLRAGGQEPGADSKAPEWIDGLIGRVPPPVRDAWLARADVCAALGLAWGEARHWTPAIESIEKALAAGKGDCPVRAIEQCASFKVRRAAEEWTKLRAEPTGADLKAERRRRIGVIHEGIGELEALCERGATGERINLLGGAWKRLAIVEAGKAGRLAALDRMAECYRKSFERGGGKEAYPFTNWASAKLLAAQLRGEEDGPWRGELEDEAGTVSEALARRLDVDPNFWDGAALGDVELVRLLARCGQAQGKALPAGCEGLVEAMLENYRSAIRRGASPREAASVVENLDFVIELLEPRGSALRQALIRVREAVPI